MAYKSGIDINFKVRVQQALDQFKYQSAHANEDASHADDLASPAILKQVVDALDLVLLHGNHEAQPGPMEDFLGVLLEANPDLTDPGDSDPVAARRYLTHEFTKAFRKIVADGLAMQTDPAYSAPLPPPQLPVRTVSTTTAPDANPTPHLSEAWRKYVEEKSHKWAGTTKDQYEGHMAEFISEDFTGDKPIGTVTRGDLIAYRTKLQKLPGGRNKLTPYKGKSIADLLAMNIPDSELLSGKSINERLSMLTTFFKWGQNAQNYAMQEGVTYDVRIKAPESKSRAPFTHDEIRALFADSADIKPRIDSPYKFWLPLIGLFTGARITEIAQLNCSDVLERDGIPALRITDKGEDQKLKTKAAPRLVPIHNILLQLGLVEYANQIRTSGQEKLFPDIPKNKRSLGAKPSQWFTEFRRARNIPDEDAEGKEKVFHSFRHTVFTFLRQYSGPNGSIDVSVIQQILGHEKSLFGATDTYVADFPMDRCNEAIQALSFPINVNELLHIKNSIQTATGSAQKRRAQKRNQE
jgi:integrase